MSDSSAPLPTSADNPPKAIPVGILVDAGPSVAKARRPVRHGRLAPRYNMVLEVPDPVVEPQRATKAEAWWLPSEGKQPPAPREPEEEPATWKCVLVWGIFAGVITTGVITGGLMAAQFDQATRRRLHAEAIQPATPAPQVAQSPAPPTVQEVPSVQSTYVAAVASLPETQPETPEVVVTQEKPVEPPKPVERPAPVAAEPAAQCALGGDGKYGTSVDFVADPAEAGNRAIAEKKLLFVLNISGNFEDDKFT